MLILSVDWFAASQRSGCFGEFLDPLGRLDLASTIGGDADPSGDAALCFARHTSTRVLRRLLIRHTNLPSQLSLRVSSIRLNFVHKPTTVSCFLPTTTDCPEFCPDARLRSSSASPSPSRSKVTAVTTSPTAWCPWRLGTTTKPDSRCVSPRQLPAWHPQTCEWRAAGR